MISKEELNEKIISLKREKRKLEKEICNLQTEIGFCQLQLEKLKKEENDSRK